MYYLIIIFLGWSLLLCSGRTQPHQLSATIPQSTAILPAGVIRRLDPVGAAARPNSTLLPHPSLLRLGVHCDRRVRHSLCVHLSGHYLCAVLWQAGTQESKFHSGWGKWVWSVIYAAWLLHDYLILSKSKGGDIGL